MPPKKRAPAKRPRPKSRPRASARATAKASARVTVGGERGTRAKTAGALVSGGGGGGSSAGGGGGGGSSAGGGGGVVGPTIVYPQGVPPTGYLMPPLPPGGGVNPLPPQQGAGGNLGGALPPNALTETAFTNLMGQMADGVRAGNNNVLQAVAALQNDAAAGRAQNDNMVANQLQRADFDLQERGQFRRHTIAEMGKYVKQIERQMARLQRTSQATRAAVGTLGADLGAQIDGAAGDMRGAVDALAEDVAVGRDAAVNARDSVNRMGDTMRGLRAGAELNERNLNALAGDVGPMRDRLGDIAAQGAAAAAANAAAQQQLRDQLQLLHNGIQAMGAAHPNQAGHLANVQTSWTTC
jgi:hypothetical protein